MMKTNIDINRLNYETYVIDYLDGNLNAVETACFMAFLENNHDIKNEVNNLGDVKLIPEDNIFVGKSKLKKVPITVVDEISEENYEEFFIAYFEGDLSGEKKNSVTKFLDVNPGLVPEFEVYGKLQIQPEVVTYLDKNSLKHKPNIMLIRYSSAAAALLLLLASWFFINKQTYTHNRDVAVAHSIRPRNYTSSLSSNIIYNIDTKNRQTIVIPESVNLQLTNNQDVAEVPHKDVSITAITNRTFDIELVNPYDFAKLVNKSEIDNTPLNDELAMNKAGQERVHRGLLAKVFKSQISKLTHSVKVNRQNHQKSTDPTYIKVIDKSLMVFNTITGSQTPTVKTYNGDGELTGYQIEGHELLLNRHTGSKFAQ